MVCPACESKLIEKNCDGIHVDVCENGCGGLWFDWLELKKFDEPHEATGAEILEMANANPVQTDMSKRHNCPKCPDIVLYRHFYSTKRHVEVDECPKCGGFWLDAGELAQIRSLFSSDAERRKVAGELFEDLFGSKLNSLNKNGEEDHKKARTIARIFRFICPSNYIPGEKDWGAW